MSEWSVRRKVVAVLAIPVVLAAVFGGLRVRSELVDANSYSTNQQRATVLGPAMDYLAATERLALPAQQAAALGRTDAKAAYTSAENDLERAASGADLSSQQRRYVADMTQIGDTLATGTGTGITATAPVQLGDMNRLTAQLINSTLNTQGTPDARSQALTQALEGRLSLVKQQLLIQSNAEDPSQLGAVWLAAEIGVEGRALESVTPIATGHRTARLVASNGTRLGKATSAKVADLEARPSLFTAYDRVRTFLLKGIQRQLATSASESKSRALTDAAIILTALLASLLLALFVARALIVPLRKLRAGTLEVANDQLPNTVSRIRAGQEPEEITPIAVHSHEELGQLARAVDDMHKQAVTLATGEAQLRSQVSAMFVTLSRRNTTLVNQQLALIESLEQDEEDPQRLEQLFSLDHLATRMRRTAESLVILGGTTGRAAGFEELSVSDVVHAAVSEVQDYQRVRIDAAPDRMIAGKAASDVVHLMAELIDNALSYSPPGSPVTIQASTDDDGKVEIEIVDNGLGMAGDALAQANESLKAGGEVTVDTARRMGLFVVSRLAAEHGLRVKLRRNTNGGGIIASIILPPAVLVSDAPVEHVSAMDAPEQVDEPVAAVADEAPDEEYDPYLERIEEAIAAVTGLPRRRPGQVPGPATAPQPAASVSMFDAGPSPELPAAFEPAELPAADESYTGSHAGSEPVSTAVEGDEPLAAPAALHDESDEALAEVVSPAFGSETHEPAEASEVPTPEPLTAAAETAVVAELDSETVVARSDEHDVPVDDGQVRLQIRRPLSPAPAASAGSALEGDFVADSEITDESTIFGQLRTNWLSDDGTESADEQWSSNEVDQGWNAAERAESEDVEDTTRTGLPVRRPGGRLLPGGVSQEPAKVVRDPEAIRNRLAAHAAGVSRGRAAAAAEPKPLDYAHEETGPA